VKLDDDERLLLTRWINHTQGRTARGGRLFVTDRRLVFQPHATERALSHATLVEIPWDQVADVIIAPRGFGPGPFTGGLRRRLKITRLDGSAEFFVINRVGKVVDEIAQLRLSAAR
jgi:hypothetical protein